MQQALFNTMLRVEAGHWWYRGRRRVVDAELDRLALPERPEILDAGCGSGRTMDLLASRGHVSGADLSPEAVAAARARGHPDVRLASAERLPWEDDSFDLVTCLDVIEHIEDDRLALAELRRVTRAGGWLLLTVPAYPLLWSSHDVANEHRRRYTRETLRAVARDAGWTWVRDTSFNALLLPAAAAVRLSERVRPLAREVSDFELTSPRLDRMLELPLRLEAALLRRGHRLPAGLSLLAVLSR